MQYLSYKSRLQIVTAFCTVELYSTALLEPQKEEFSTKGEYIYAQCIRNVWYDRIVLHLW